MEKSGLTEQEQQLWAFVRAFDASLQELPEAFQFGDSPQMADELLALVLARQKTGTAGWPIELYPQVQPGLLSIVLDGQNQPKAIIRTVRAERIPFLQVTPEFAASEGEGDLTLEWWRMAHRRFFSRQPDLPRPFTDNETVLCETFEVVWP